MIIDFDVDQRLLNDGVLIKELQLSKLFLVNNCLYPWMILVPRVVGAREIIDLNDEQQMMLIKEIDLISRVLKKMFNPYKLNVASLGNIVEQLHVHIIARFKEDNSWPNPVFGRDKLAYTQDEMNKFLTLFTTELNKYL